MTDAVQVAAPTQIKIDIHANSSNEQMAVALKLANTLFYIASPYTKYEGGLDLAEEHIRKIYAFLLSNSIRGFCPIVSHHATSKLMPEEVRLSHEFWMAIDLPILIKCDAVIVVKMAGWQESRGVQEEIATATRFGKPIVYLEESVVNAIIGDTIDVMPHHFQTALAAAGLSIFPSSLSI